MAGSSPIGCGNSQGRRRPAILLPSVATPRSTDAKRAKSVQGAIADARHGLTDVKEQAKRRPHCYAIIPYEGPNQTHRRPIYLECRADTVVIQPEGIELGEADFDGPLGAGNPLAAALRAAREYLVNRGTYDPQCDGEPYPLLLVRPRGMISFTPRGWRCNGGSRISAMS